MNSPAITIPLKNVEVLGTIGSYQILKVPKKFGATLNNIPVKKLKPAAERKLLARDKEIMRKYKLGKCKTLKSFSELFE